MWEAVAKLFSYIMSWFTPERQTQRLKDELWKLKAEEQRICLEKWSIKNEKRIASIRTRITIIDELLRNRAY